MYFFKINKSPSTFICVFQKIQFLHHELFFFCIFNRALTCKEFLPIILQQVLSHLFHILKAFYGSLMHHTYFPPSHYFFICIICHEPLPHGLAPCPLGKCIGLFSYTNVSIEIIILSKSDEHHLQILE